MRMQGPTGEPALQASDMPQVSAAPSAVTADFSERWARGHQVERAIQRELLGQPGLKFSSLVIRRVRDGVCLEGVVEANDESPDVCRLVRMAAGVDQVLNHLVVRRGDKE